MAGDGFEVVLSELGDAAAAYKTQNDSVQQALARFRAAADLPRSAFGNMSESARLAAQYQEFLGQVTNDVTKLHQTLLGGAAALAAAKAKYVVAEDLVLLYLEYLKQGGPQIPEQDK
jgi:hypothetical protein